MGVLVLLLGAHSAWQVAAWHGRGRVPTPLAPECTLRLDPNTATAAELELLPGVGPTLAANIIAYRAGIEGRRAFERPADLDAVPRIGAVTIERLKPFLWFPEDEDTGGVEDVTYADPSATGDL